MFYFLFKIFPSSISSPHLKKRSRSSTFCDSSPPNLQKYFKASPNHSPELIYDPVTTTPYYSRGEFMASYFKPRSTYTALCLDKPRSYSLLVDILNLSTEKNIGNNRLFGLTLCKRILHNWILNHHSDPVSTTHKIALHTLDLLNNTADLRLPLSSKLMNQLIRKTFNAPVLFLGGWENHSISYIVHNKVLYVCNTGKGSIPYHSDPDYKSVISFKLSDFQEIKDVLYYLKHIQSEPYSPFFVDWLLKRQTLSPSHRFSFAKYQQRGPNCWYRSPLFGINLMMILIGKSFGLSFVDSHQVYKSILGKEARIKSDVYYFFSHAPDSPLKPLLEALTCTYKHKLQKLTRYQDLVLKTIKRAHASPLSNTSPKQPS